jgi:ATP-dependent DNA helicase RecG
LSLLEIVLLDKLQKKQHLTAEAIKLLRRKKLVEGHHSHIHISKQVALTTGQQVEYLLAKGLDDDYFKEMIIRYIKESFASPTRADFERLLIPKLPESLSYEQRQHKVKNLLQDLRREGRIHTNGDRSWALSISV